MMRTLLGLIGTFLLFFMPVPWILGSYMILVAGSGETFSVRSTGMVTCPEVLKWTEWRTGSGPVTRTHHDVDLRLDKNAEIVEYRVGRDAMLFAELTFYQAKYRSTDGTITIAPADGPKSLVSVNESLAMTYSIVSGVLGIICLLMMCYLPALRPNSVHELA